MKAVSGLQTKTISLMQTSFMYQLLPHLMATPNSLQPAYHLRGGRLFSEVVIGIPTVKRDKESYLMITLSHLISGLTTADLNNTLIVIFVGETDLEYVLNIARQVETTFPKHVANGLIEVISPSASYYPNLETLPLTLGDSIKRVKWRTKQNLDAIYLMAYAQTKGTFYLMLEDDVIAKNKYMQDPHFGALQTYYPHNNPPVKRITSDIKEHADHTIKRAYEGKTYFWGIKPNEGDAIVFWFAKPTAIAR
ncbi:jg4599 [Pararge aegeria aegeria]|uniref:Jg4599 protein n=1 Tax=Pararge aegeria aegeria TaxID=348720 RepID=A0A8S4RGR0_9NEOP|nr:jg4599 [Pararge aegeria aegeria]